MKPGGRPTDAPVPSAPAPPSAIDDPDLRPHWTRESMALRLPGVTTLDDLSTDWAWGGSTGRGVRVAVIDSGIEADHPDLDDCVDADGGVVVTLGDDGEPVVTVGRHDDVFGHGTACAGIIHGLAPDARITSVRVLGAGLTGKSNVFLAGLAWAVEQGFDVINLSLGTGKRDWALPFYELCDQAYFRGSFLVTAANNMARPSFPSLYASVTSVACNLSRDPLHFHYNPEPPTEFLASGIDVDVSWRGGTRQQGTGNSYAAPHIAGIAALIKSKHADLRPFQMKTVLWATASNVQEASAVAGRLTSALTASRLTALGGRATAALRVARGPTAP
jgi:subtilisin